MAAPFQLTKHLGGGGFGAVYGMKFNNEKCALKVIGTPDDSVPYSWYINNITELIVGLSVPYRRILKCIGTYSGNESFTLEDGKTIRIKEENMNLIYKGYDSSLESFPPIADIKERLHIVGSIAKTIALMNMHNIYHNDIKMGNVLINTAGGKITDLVVSDFGLVRYMKDNMKIHTEYVAGTVGKNVPIYSGFIPAWGFDAFGLAILCCDVLFRNGTGVGLSDIWNQKYGFIVRDERDLTSLIEFLKTYSGNSLLAPTIGYIIKMLKLQASPIDMIKDLLPSGYMEIKEIDWPKLKLPTYLGASSIPPKYDSSYVKLLTHMIDRDGIKMFEELYTIIYDYMQRHCATSFDVGIIAGDVAFRLLTGRIVLRNININIIIEISNQLSGRFGIMF